MVFTPYSQLTADQQAAKKLDAIAATLPAKRHSAIRILRNASSRLIGREIHPSNYGEVARLWKRL
jgi:uncharacterized protein (DUF2342 family)